MSDEKSTKPGMSTRTGILIFVAIVIAASGIQWVFEELLGDWFWIAYVLCALWFLSMLIWNKRKYGTYWGC